VQKIIKAEAIIIWEGLQAELKVKNNTTILRLNNL
jgi:hypothetical protein